MSSRVRIFGNQQPIRDKLLCAELDRDAQFIDHSKVVPQPNHFIPPVPIRILERVEQAGAMTAMGLILAIHRQLTTSRRDSTPLNAAIWRAAGLPSKKRKEGILRNLAKVPDVVVLQKARSRRGYYRVARGGLWLRGPI